MSVTSWALWLLLSAGAAAGSFAWYRWREPAGRGRLLLAGMRSAAFALVLLLLLDPELPAVARPGADTLVLLDASLSMEGAWRDARAEALGADAPVLLFGNDVRPSGDVVPDSAPGDARSLLLPALRAAAEAGARRAVVVTDGRIEDAAAVARWLPRLGVEVEVRSVGSDVAGPMVEEVEAPRWLEAGDAATVSFAVGGASAGAAVVVRQDGRVLGRAEVDAATGGRLATGSVEVRPVAPAGGGWVPLEVAVEGVAAPRTVYVHVGEEPAGVALVSLRPDWEPRFLAPVLESALGVPLRAYIRGAEGQYVRLAAGLEAGEPADEAEVRRAIGNAGVLVLHGLDDGSPEWARSAATAARRVLVFPAGPVSDVVPVSVGAEVAGDFFATSRVPASPVAALLGGLELDAVAPLAGLRPVTGGRDAANAWAPLEVTRGRQGPTAPAVVAGEAAGRRWAVALASGWWQWAFRGGADREAYVRVWSAVAGWLARDPVAVAVPSVRPAAMALPRGAAVPWVAPGLAWDSMAVEITDGDGTSVADTVLVRVAGDTAWSAVPTPGAYRYRARAWAGADSLSGGGEFTVEAWSPELSRPRVPPERFAPAGTVVRDTPAAPARGRPLHRLPWVWLALVGVLASEWVLRRRWGLR